MIDVIDKILNEQELRLFDMTANVWPAMRRVMSTNMAVNLYAYITNPDADPELVSRVKEELFETMKPYIIDKILDEQGVVDIVANNNPYSFDRTNLDSIITKIEKLQEEYGSIQTELHAPTKQDWVEFLEALEELQILAVREYGFGYQRKDISGRFQDNKMLFFGKDCNQLQGTITMLVNKKQSWEKLYKGANYVKYCDEHGIGEDKRWLF